METCGIPTRWLHVAVKLYRPELSMTFVRRSAHIYCRLAAFFLVTKCTFFSNLERLWLLSSESGAITIVEWIPFIPYS
ncbi:hypothetical protein PGB90_007033 [Kerria lacca]